MKKHTFVLLVLVLSFILAACGTASQPISTEEASVEESVAQDTPSAQNFERETPQALQLMIGIFKLEDTSSPITAEQASEMLPLWKALRSLGESETTANEELDAVVNQISDVFTPDQLAAIESMNLGFEDLRTIAEQMGIEFGGGGRFDDLTPEMQATMEAARESGQFPEGGFGGGPGGGPGGGLGGGPGAGGGFGGEGGLSPEARQTAIAERGGVRGANLGLNPVFLDALIDLLETKAG